MAYSVKKIINKQKKTLKASFFCILIGFCQSSLFMQRL
ncbi:hypothetical protein [uncultured Gammaproteobacteria bacterium]|nr:hypothetical protein [uncultured Gammaproteobacteria bacterium]